MSIESYHRDWLTFNVFNSAFSGVCVCVRACLFLDIDAFFGVLAASNNFNMKLKQGIRYHLIRAKVYSVVFTKNTQS